jgi:formate dehydrogenase major subunit
MQSLDHGDWATVTTPRGIVEARVLVTRRCVPCGFRTPRASGRSAYHWGYRGRVQGDVVNDLLAISEEPNVRIMESKALVCDVAPGGGPPEKRHCCNCRRG